METQTKEGFFKIKHRLWIHIMCYLVLIVGLVVGCFLTIKSYVKYQPIVMEPTIPLTTQDLIEIIPIEATEESILQHITEDELSRLFFNKLKDYNPPMGKDVTLQSYYYDTQESISYFNFIDQNEKLYSFVAQTELNAKDEKLILSLSNFKLGKYKIGPLGQFYGKKLDIADTIEMDFNDLDKMIYISSIDVKDRNQIVCHYTYNVPLTKQNFQDYKEQLDYNKVAIYAKEDAQIKAFAEVLENIDGYVDEGILKWMSVLQSDRQVMENCALILKDNGVRKMCSDFQVLHNNTLQPERIIEVSQNELNYALMQYHKDFSRILLNYLYRNKGYSYNNGQLMVNGSLLEAGKVLSEKGKESLYGVEILSDTDGISAYYHTGDEGVQKLILRKE
ncbi:MAG TPA: hypothetical protein GX707_18875 [Epulopiscium sp.]|nr:hypothetical protein [Candidatus Epulonipiscium sp.]